MSDQSSEAAFPRRGNRFSRWLGRRLLLLFGWKIEGQFPDCPKLLVVVAPHTSNWDFVLGILTVFSLGLDARWVAKHTLFNPPFGWLLRRLGGIPVDRRAAHGFVNQLVAAYKNESQLLLAITPEGTRKKVKQWKSGFHQIASRANVPLVPASIDYSRKSISILPVFPLSGSFQDDLPAIQNLFTDVVARHPENF